MWTFAILLPLIIGDLVPEEGVLSVAAANCQALHRQGHFYCSISNYCCTNRPASSKFQEVLFCTVLTPKMHYMVHFPQQLLRLAVLEVSNTIIVTYIYIILTELVLW